MPVYRKGRLGCKPQSPKPEDVRGAVVYSRSCVFFLLESVSQGHKAIGAVPLNQKVELPYMFNARSN